MDSTLLKSPKALQVFISYRREKGGIAYAYILKEKLSALGIECFFDIETMRDSSRDFEKEIGEHLTKSDYVIVLLQDGCLRERENEDYFLKEIRSAVAENKELIFLPIGDNFVWENQDNVPKDIYELNKHNLSTPLTIKNISVAIQDLLSLLKLNNYNRYYSLLYNMLSHCTASSPALQKTSDIYAQTIDKRWENAERVSLLAVGCSSVVHRHIEIIKKMSSSDAKFRFLAVDPEGESAKDFTYNKLNGSSNGSRENFLTQNYEQIIIALKNMTTRNMMEGKQNIEYKLTSAHITFTMQWVECKNDNESYIYIEYLPIDANEVVQDTHPAVIIKRHDPAYSFYVNQFEKCWRNSRNVLEDTKQKNCEFCYPPETDERFILFKTQFWCVYLANNQNYPGRCIIPLWRHCPNLSEITEQEMIDLQRISKLLEKIWKSDLGATNFNWTCLMNGGYSKKPFNPHVHFHFIPRFEKPYETTNGDFYDSEFGKHYTLDDVTQALNEDDRLKLCQYLKAQIKAETNLKFITEIPDNQ